MEKKIDNQKPYLFGFQPCHEHLVVHNSELPPDLAVLLRDASDSLMCSRISFAHNVYSLLGHHLSPSFSEKPLFSSPASVALLLGNMLMTTLSAGVYGLKGVRPHLFGRGLIEGKPSLLFSSVSRTLSYIVDPAFIGNNVISIASHLPALPIAGFQFVTGFLYASLDMKSAKNEVDRLIQKSEAPFGSGISSTDILRFNRLSFDDKGNAVLSTDPAHNRGSDMKGWRRIAAWISYHHPFQRPSVSLSPVQRSDKQTREVPVLHASAQKL